MIEPRYIIDPRGQAYRLAYRPAFFLRPGDIVFDVTYRPYAITDILDYGFGVVLYCDGFADYFEDGEAVMSGQATE